MPVDQQNADRRYAMKDLPESLTEALGKNIAPWTNLVKQDFHVSVFKDAYPVTEGHLLFVPEYTSNSVVVDAIADAYEEGMRQVKAGNWEGFNIGMNIGECAGQTVPWPHVHLIPRKAGDTPDPIGGVRNVVKGQGNYKKSSYKKPKA